MENLDSVMVKDDSQIKVSLFGGSRKNTKPFLIISEDKIVERIKNKPKGKKGKRFSKWLVDQNPKTYRSVVYEDIAWSASFDSNQDINSLADCNGLICIGFVNLITEQFDSLRTTLLNDKFTRILYLSPADNSFKVIIKTSLKKLNEFYSYFNWLTKYYCNNCSISTSNIDLADHGIYQLNHSAYDPDVFYNPNSKWLILSDQIIQSTIDGSETVQFKNDVYDNKIEAVSDSTTVEGKENEKQEIIVKFNFAYHQAELPKIHEYCAKKFLEIIGQQDDLEIAIQSTTKWNQINQSWELTYFIIKNKKKINCVNFIHDSHLNTTIIANKIACDCECTKRKPKAAIQDVCQSLLTLLDTTELEQGDVQRRLAEIHKCSYETIRDRMEEIFKKTFLICIATGKRFVLVKRSQRPKHFLSLTSIN